jgi:periplasmic protein TonB
MNTHAVVENHDRVQTAMAEHLKVVAGVHSTPPVRQKELFEESLLETSSGQRRRRTSATVLSFVLQCFLVGILILVPLWFTDVLPPQQLVTFLVTPPPPPPPPPPADPASANVKVVKVASDIMNGRLRTPTRIPEKVQIIKEAEAPPPIALTGGVVGGIPGGIPGGQLGGVIGGIISSTSNLAAVPKLVPKVVVAPVQRVRVSQGVTKGLLLYRIEPAYPPLARQARIQGVVLLTAIIDKSGNIQNLQLLSGHPMLAPAAIDAVKQWRYKPFLLNGQPVEVETTITVNFQLHE